MISVSTITLALGIIATIGAGVANYFIVKDEPTGNLRDELNVNMGLLVFCLILSVVFPPLGILALLTSALINIHASTLETDQSKHNWLVIAAFSTMAGAILTVLSVLYKVVVNLRPGVEIPTTTIIATILGAVLVFGSAISNFVIAGREQDPTTRSELYWSTALSFASLVFLPASFLLRNASPTIGNFFIGLSILALVASMILNVIVAGHEGKSGDADTHSWLIINSIAQLVGMILFTAAIYYLGTVKAAPAIAGLTQASGMVRGFAEVAEEPLPGPTIRERIEAPLRSRYEDPLREELAGLRKELTGLRARVPLPEIPPPPPPKLSPRQSMFAQEDE